MEQLFLSILRMSITASYVILFVALIRLPLKRVPRTISYGLWSVVAVRLIVPISFKSTFSLLPRSTNTIHFNHDIIYQQDVKITGGANVAIEALPAPTIGVLQIAAYVWILGLLALLLYGFISILILSRQLNNAQLLEKNIYEAENLKTPFVMGFMRPRIYLPIGLSEEERLHILLHEQTHICRKDYIVKIIAFIMLSIHWFNPLVWIAFMLMNTDMELSCDEQVLKIMGSDQKKPYATSLLSLATGKRMINGSPLSFGEGNLTERIKNVLNYKKPRFWISLVSILVVTVIGFGLMTNPEAKELDESNGVRSLAWEVITKDIANYELNPEVSIIDSKITNLQLIETFDELTSLPIEVYALEYRLRPNDLSKVVLAGGMDIDENGWLKETCSMGSPLLVVAQNDNSLELIGVIWTGEFNDNMWLESGVKSLLKQEGFQLTVSEDERKALHVLQEYFDAFAMADYNTMKQLATDAHNKNLVHDGDVWGMKWAKATQIQNVSDPQFLGIENLKTTMVFDVSVDMETVASSAQYPSTQTSFCVVMVKDKSGNWLIDYYTTG